MRAAGHALTAWLLMQREHADVLPCLAACVQVIQLQGDQRKNVSEFLIEVSSSSTVGLIMAACTWSRCQLIVPVHGSAVQVSACQTYLCCKC